MNVLDLFSGIGGFSLGLERAGMHTVAFCESNPFCRRVLAKHWPEVRQYGDIRTLTAELIRADGISFDIIAGGFPCKQTSTAAAIHSRRTGLAGAESSLFEELARLVGECRPEWCLIENPMGVSTWADTITRRLESFGYEISRSKFAASDFGAPHLRERIVFIANRDGKRLEVARPSGPSEAEGVPWRTPPGDFWRKDQSGAWRMDDGLPDRVDRLAALGNAVVPQIPELIGRAIMKQNTLTRSE